MRLLFILTHTDLTGVNTFNYTVIAAIKRKYRETTIDVILPNSKGSILKNQLSEFVNIIDHTYHNKYDIIYFNYENNDGLFESLIGEKRFFVHGLMCENNIPKKKYDKVYCFGERSFGFIKADNKELIRNYIDCDRFKRIPSSYYLEKILIHSSRDSQIMLSPIISAAKAVNAYVSFTGSDFLNKQKQWNVENDIISSNLVIAYGRCAIEAMATGRNVVIFGVNGGDGYVNESNFWDCAQTNFSGWSKHSLKFDLDSKTVNDLIIEFKKYNPKDAITNYELIRDNFDINKNINKFI